MPPNLFLHEMFSERYCFASLGASEFSAMLKIFYNLRISSESTIPKQETERWMGKGILERWGWLVWGGKGILARWGRFSNSETQNKELRSWLTMFRFGGGIKKA